MSRLNPVRRPSTLTATFVGAPLPDGLVTVRYRQVGGALVFECCGQTARNGRVNLAPETWRAWLDRGVDLVVEPGAPSPAWKVRVTDTRGRDLVNTAGVPTALTGPARVAARLLFAERTGMSFKVTLDGVGAVEIDLADAGTQIRPPPPKLPVDAPKAN